MKITDYKVWSDGSNELKIVQGHVEGDDYIMGSLVDYPYFNRN